MRAAWLPLALIALGGCDGAAPQGGLISWLRTSNGQFTPGELSGDDTMTGPAVDTVKTVNTRVFPGALSRSLTGTVEPDAVAVALGLEGDSAHWVVPLGPRDVPFPQWTFGTSLSFSPDVPLGPRALRVRAIDENGNLGPIQSLNVRVDLPVPTGALIIQLSWDTEADLDLHVRITDPSVMPAGFIDVWNKAPLALPPKDSSQPPYTRAETAAAGRLQFDSNEQCIIDGARHEEVVFPPGSAVPPGPYEVRVDTPSLCSEYTARWHVAAFVNTNGTPTLIQEAYGQSTDRDTVGSHGAGDGVLAFTFSP